MRNNYDKSLITRLINSEKWPDIENRELLGKLVKIAKEAFSKETTEGFLSAILIYTQIVEELLRVLLKYSELYLQGEIWPTRIQIGLPDKMTFGQLIGELDRSIDFKDKAQLISKCKNLNKIRIDFVHKIKSFKSLTDLEKAASRVERIFSEIQGLYLGSVEGFDGKLEDLNKRVDFREMI